MLIQINYSFYDQCWEAHYSIIDQQIIQLYLFLPDNTYLYIKKIPTDHTVIAILQPYCAFIIEHFTMRYQLQYNVNLP